MKREQSSGSFLSAVFVDYDNIYMSLKRKSDEAAKRFAKDAGLWIKAIETGSLITPTNGPGTDGVRRIVMNRCYGNPVPRRNQSDNSTDMSSFPFVRHHFLRSGFEIVDCPPLTAQLKNSSDIRMVMDVRDFLTHATYFDEFVILSGDADFTPVLHRLRAHARRTVIFANDNTAAPYTAICDGEIRESDLIALLLEGRLGAETPVAELSSKAEPHNLESIKREILAEVTAAVRAAQSPVPLEVLADRAVRMIGHDRTIGTSWVGAGGFRELLAKELPDGLRLSGEPPYVVIDASRHIQAQPVHIQTTHAAPAPLQAQTLQAQPLQAHNLQSHSLQNPSAPQAQPQPTPIAADFVETRRERALPQLGSQPLQQQATVQQPAPQLQQPIQQPAQQLAQQPAAQTAAALQQAGQHAPAAAAGGREVFAQRPAALQARNVSMPQLNSQQPALAAPLAPPAQYAPSAPIGRSRAPEASTGALTGHPQYAPQQQQQPAAPTLRSGDASTGLQPSGLQPAGTQQSGIQQSIARIHDACQAPPLAPPEYRLLFETIAHEINENGLIGAQTILNIAQRVLERGIEMRRDDVRFVLEVVSEADPWFEQGASANLFAGRFRNFVVARCRSQGLNLSADELDLIEAWFAGNGATSALASAAPQQHLPQQHASQQQSPQISQPAHITQQSANQQLRQAPMGYAEAPAQQAPRPLAPMVDPRATGGWSLEEGRQYVAEQRGPGRAPQAQAQLAQASAPEPAAEEFPRIVRTRLRG